jgi:membrane protein insertase Oxa1/YidC/SpoIIIJ
MLWMEMLKLYKEEKINPFSSFWLLFLQMPILIVIYHVILSIQSYSNMYYLYWFIWDYSVSLINNTFFWFNLLWVWWVNWIILAVTVWALQFVQIKLSLSYNKQNNSKTWIVLEKKKDAKDYESFMQDPEMLNKFMLYWLPVMIWFATYSFFAWVWIYWWIWTAFMIVQQLFVNKIFKK